MARVMPVPESEKNRNPALPKGYGFLGRGKKQEKGSGRPWRGNGQAIELGRFNEPSWPLLARTSDASLPLFRRYFQAGQWHPKNQVSLAPGSCVFLE
jgi:hypothetical protein